jgi:endonuclease III-like uncharacterized protein
MSFSKHELKPLSQQGLSTVRMMGIPTHFLDSHELRRMVEEPYVKFPAIGALLLSINTSRVAAQSAAQSKIREDCLYAAGGIATLGAGIGGLIWYSLSGSSGAVPVSCSVAQAPHIALFQMSGTGVAATPINPAFLTSLLAIDPSVLASLSILDPTCTALLVVAGGVACVVAADQLKKYIEENQKSQEEKLKNTIPGAKTYGQEYTSKVITSLQRYFDREKNSESKVETFADFADFVAKNIIEKLEIKTFEDLLQQDNINKLSQLKSGTSTIFGDNRGELHIEKLIEEFRKNNQNNPQAIETIPGEAELPSATISAGFYTCCGARQK